MKLFDLHCDTLTECCLQGKRLRDNDLHISLSRGAALKKWVQTFAVFMPDELRGRAAADYFDKNYSFYLSEFKEPHSVIPILSVEGGSVLCGDISRVSMLAERQVKLLTLTWNGENELGYGALSGEKAGLKAFGKLAVRELNRAGIVPDVSHLNTRGFFDVAENCEGAFIASHSNSRAVCEHPRNLNDEQSKIIIERKGLIGINLYESFLGGDRACGAAYAHISHFLDLGAENALAIGTDFDGCTVSPLLAGIEKIGVLYEYLLKKGLSENTADKIFFENASAFFGIG